MYRLAPVRTASSERRAFAPVFLAFVLRAKVSAAPADPRLAPPRTCYHRKEKKIIFFLTPIAQRMEAVGCCVVRDNFQAFKHRWPRLLFCSWVPFLPTCANHAIKRFRVAVCDEGVLHTFFKGCKRMRARARVCVCVCVYVFYGRQLPPMCKKYIQSRTRVPETAEGSPLRRDDLATHVPLLPKAV